MKDLDLGNFMKKERLSIAVLTISLVLFFALLALARADQEEPMEADEYAEYEKAVVTAILSDNTVLDPDSDDSYRGEQLLTALVKSGQYKGTEMMAYNYTGPLFGSPLSEGDGVILLISTYSNGDHTAVVYEFNRMTALAVILIIFFVVTVLIGGRTGLKSLIGLVFTILCLFAILIPLLLKGAPTIITTFLLCAYISLVSFVILGGVHRKTVSAFLGTAAGTALATLFGLLAQALSRVNGLRISDVEPLLQLRQTGTPIGLKGLLVAGIIISALGAVMDVAMSISSALEEVHQADPTLNSRQLFRSGMNIGRDMVGTMTNTLILAFLGRGFVLTIYLYSLGLSFYQLFPSSYVSIEIISGIASSIGMILAIPLTAMISSLLLKRSDSSQVL